MKKTVWITFFVSLVAVNIAAWLTARYTGFNIAMPFRLALVMGITVITTVFAGAMELVRNLDKEQPLTREPRKQTETDD